MAADRIGDAVAVAVLIREIDCCCCLSSAEIGECYSELSMDWTIVGLMNITRSEVAAAEAQTGLTWANH